MPSSYAIADLGPSDATYAVPFGLNELGAAVGTFRQSYGAYKPVIWSNGNATTLPFLGGGSDATPRAINESGVVVGGADDGTGGNFAAQWANGVVTSLGALSDPYSQAFAINDAGVAAGESLAPDRTVHAVKWQSGAIVDLGVLPGGDTSSARGINSDGQIVGYSEFEHGGAYHAIIWDESNTTDIGALPGDEASNAVAINDAGHVAGGSIDFDGGSQRGFFWDGISMREIPLLPDGTFVEASAVNDSDQVVGRTDTTGGQTAFVFDATTAEMTDLQTLLPSGTGWDLMQAFAINDAGQIAGYGYRDGVGLERGFLMTPATGVDATAPTITFSSPAAGASYTLGQSLTASYGCDDETGGSGLAACTGAVDGNSVADGASVPTDTAGAHTFTVSATDSAGNVRTETHTYDVLAGSTSQPVSGGETVTTDPGAVGATTAVPVQTAITVPAGVSGTLSITLQDTSASSPTGYSFFGTEVQLSGPPASADSPYQATFTVDVSLLGNVAPADLQIFRNGARVSDCLDATAAIPDPCVASRAVAAGGDATITVRTSAFSTWNIGALRYTVSAFASPIVAPPRINKLKAGASSPLRFSLGGNRGLDVFVTGYPRSAGYVCGAAPPNPSAGTATSGALTYDAAKNTYTYTWKTTKTMKGCRQLALRLRDGTLRTALFDLK